MQGCFCARWFYLHILVCSWWCIFVDVRSIFHFNVILTFYVLEWCNSFMPKRELGLNEVLLIIVGFSPNFPVSCLRAWLIFQFYDGLFWRFRSSRQRQTHHLYPAEQHDWKRYRCYWLLTDKLKYATWVRIITTENRRFETLADLNWI